MTNEVRAIIIMNANFMIPWTFSVDKQELSSNMSWLLLMIRIYNVKAWNKWRMNITSRLKLRQLHHNLLKKVNKNFMTKLLQCLPSGGKQFYHDEKISTNHFLLEKVDIHIDHLINKLQQIHLKILCLIQNLSLILKKLSWTPSIWSCKRFQQVIHGFS